jgi:acetyl esterase/lipase
MKHLLTRLPAALLAIAAANALQLPCAAADNGQASKPQPWVPTQIGPLPLYDGDIPNSKAVPDTETQTEPAGMEVYREVSHPTYMVYLPAPARATGAALVIFPGGGYGAVVWAYEGTPAALAFQDRGIAAIIVKYRLPSDRTMVDKAIGPLQDAQQALLQVRRHSKSWGIDPARIGVMGFSAGGHLASTVGTHFDTELVPDPEGLGVRPDCMILIYPVITMADAKTHRGTRNALIGPHPDEGHVRRFSNELQVGPRTPPTLLLAAENDSAVDVDNSISFFEALRHNGVPAEMVLFPTGEHGFVQISRAEWMAPVWAWLGKNGWLRP